MKQLLAIMTILCGLTVQALDRCEAQFDSRFARDTLAKFNELNPFVGVLPSALASASEHLRTANFEFEAVQNPHLPGAPIFLEVKNGPNRIGRIALALSKNYGSKLLIASSMERGVHGYVDGFGNLVMPASAADSFELALPILIHEVVHVKTQMRIRKGETENPLAIAFRSEDYGLMKSGYHNYFRTDEALAFYRGSKTAESLGKSYSPFGLKRWVFVLDKILQKKSSSLIAKASVKFLKMAEIELEENGLANVNVVPRDSIELTLKGLGLNGNDVHVMYPIALEGFRRDFILRENKDLILDLLQAQTAETLARVEVIRASLTK